MCYHPYCVVLSSSHVCPADLWIAISRLDVLDVHGEPVEAVGEVSPVVCLDQVERQPRGVARRAAAGLHAVNHETDDLIL